MPCNSDYMEPTAMEMQLQRTAKLLVWLCRKRGVPPESWVVKESRNCYASRKDLVPSLCSMIRTLTPEQVEQYIYDAHDRTSRQLAEWWETHQRADVKRHEEEQKERVKASARRSGLAKL